MIPAGAPVAAVSRNPNQLDLFITGNDGCVYTSAWTNGGNWNNSGSNNPATNTGGFLIAIEALLIGQRFGLDPGVMTDVLNAATGMNNSTQKKFRQFVLSRKFDAGFTMGLLAKDLSIAMQVGRETATPAPLSALVNEMIVSALAKFGPDADHTEMAKLSELLAGSELKAG